MLINDLDVIQETDKLCLEIWVIAITICESNDDLVN